MKTIKFLLLSVFFLIGNITLHAQERKMPTPEEMHEKKWEFLNKTAELSADEASKVKPVFMDYEQKMWQLHGQERNLWRKKNETPDYKQLNDQYIDREIKQADYLKVYHDKLQQILTPERLFNYYRAERSYKRKLVMEMQQHHQKHRPGPPAQKN